MLLYHSRIKSFSDLKFQASYCFDAEIKHDVEFSRTFFENERLRELLSRWLKKAEGFASFGDICELEQMTRELAEVEGVKAKDLIHPLRYAISAQTVTPGLFELMSILGKEKCSARVKAFLSMNTSVTG